MSKLSLLRAYISLQRDDRDLWFIPTNTGEVCLQQELRQLQWLIEEASENDIKRETELYKDRMAI